MCIVHNFLCPDGATQQNIIWRNEKIRKIFFFFIGDYIACRSVPRLFHNRTIRTRTFWEQATPTLPTNTWQYWLLRVPRQEKKKGNRNGTRQRLDENAWSHFDGISSAFYFPERSSILEWYQNICQKQKNVI